MQMATHAKIPEELRAWVNSRLVTSHLRDVTPMALGLLLNLAISFVALWQQVDLNAQCIIAFAIFSGALFRVRLAEKCRHHRQDISLADHVRSFERNSIWLGFFGGLLVAWALPLVSPPAQVILILSASTQIGALAFNTRTLPTAAIWHIGLIGAGIAAGLLQLNHPIAWAGVALVSAANVLQARMIHVAHKSNVDRLIKGREMRNNAATIRMLLNDYEEQGSDWVFELEKDGRIINANQRFADAVGSSVAALNGSAFSSLFLHGSSRKDLQAALEAGHLVRDSSLKLAKPVAGEQRWWSVSVRPLPQSMFSTARFRGVISDISAERQAQARMLRMANYDSLTELPNRLMFNTALGRLFTGTIQFDKVALLLIDCDHFKTVNDVYGHPVGDQFLKLVSKRISDTVEESGLAGEGHLIARLGGDEFGVLMSGEDVVDKAVRLADLLVAQFDGDFQINDHEISTSLSIGIALAPKHAISAESLTSKADIALYAAKDAGRARWEMFESGMDEEVHRRHLIAREMRDAVTRGELRLFLQPLVHAESRTLNGFEALMRWEHEQLGMVMPDEFIPIAEETGLIVPMGEWMIRTALMEAAQWSAPLAIAINLSPVQLRNPGLLTVIVQALAESGIDPNRVEFEITETVLMNESEANVSLLKQIQSLGVKIALDDFGTGYASLSYLLSFPFDKIKIDRSFVNNLEEREESRAIIAAVISLANRLGMCTLAEGVEEEFQLANLQEQGCSMVQGWLFGKALPAADYVAAMVPHPALSAKAA